MPDLQSAVEDWLAAMPEKDFRALVCRTRPPDEPFVETAPARSEQDGRR
jgi:hypothetical protein